MVQSTVWSINSRIVYRFESETKYRPFFTVFEKCVKDFCIGFINNNNILLSHTLYDEEILLLAHPIRDITSAASDYT